VNTDETLDRTVREANIETKCARYVLPLFERECFPRFDGNRIVQDADTLLDFNPLADHDPFRRLICTEFVQLHR